jgi:hypothetical protein
VVWEGVREGKMLGQDIGSWTGGVGSRNAWDEILAAFSEMEARSEVCCCGCGCGEDGGGGRYAV